VHSVYAGHMYGVQRLRIWVMIGQKDWELLLTGETRWHILMVSRSVTDWDRTANALCAHGETVSRKEEHTELHCPVLSEIDYYGVHA